MRLLESVLDVDPGRSARASRQTQPDDFYFQGHFPGHPVVPAVILIEMVAQTGGLAAASIDTGSTAALQMRVAAVGPFKFPSAAGAGEILEARARVAGRMGGLVKVEGEVTASGRVVASGSVTLAESR